ncbi:hypothetical protein K440DRAFT_644023 [Wilcoxina mikolae CBS 423.85]|nr:hypothetical protein K440DRAFT_644023 [Wilcoxina mikolae CBS 423.85]
MPPSLHHTTTALQPHIAHWLHSLNLPSTSSPPSFTNHGSEEYKSFTCTYYSILPLPLESLAKHLLHTTARHQKWARIAGEEEEGGVMYQDQNGVLELEERLLEIARGVVGRGRRGEREMREEFLGVVNNPPTRSRGRDRTPTTPEDRTTPEDAGYDRMTPEDTRYDRTTPEDDDIDRPGQEGFYCVNEYYYPSPSYSCVLPLKPRMECENGEWVLYFENEDGVVVSVDKGAGIESYGGARVKRKQYGAYQGNVVIVG